MIRTVLLAAGFSFLVACGGSDYPDAGPEFADTGETIDVVLETELGNIHVELFSEKAPRSTKDFLYYVDKGLYDNEGFYRVVTPENDNRNMGMSIIQGGRLDLQDLTLVEHEPTQDTGLSNIVGTLALARGEVGTGSAAFFFINLNDNTMLDQGGTRNPDGYGYAVFGRITKGLDVAYKIQQTPTFNKGEAYLLSFQFGQPLLIGLKQLLFPDVVQL